MKKLLALMMAVVLVLSLTACGGSGSSTPVSGGGSVSGGNDTSSASSGDYPVIRWAYSTMWNNDSESAVEEAINEILRESCGAEIDLVAVNFSSMQEQYNLLLSGGKDTIDIFSSFWYLPLSTLVANGQIADITDLIEDYPEMLALFDDYPEVLDCCKIDGKMYALPTVAPYASPMLFLC